MRKVLYLQLPRLDNEARGRTENLPLAGRYLHHALERDGIRATGRFEYREDSDAALLDEIGAWRPDLVVATLYLWNIERTLHVLRLARRILPGVFFCVGGPEVSRRHPLLFRSRVPDVAVSGEGEAVFPEIVRELAAAAGRGGPPALRRIPARADWDNVAWRIGRRYLWGRHPAPVVDLATQLPPPGHPCWTPDEHGMAWIETGRGCPLRCAYCRYPQLRQRMTFVRPQETLARISVLRRRGAREIRFIDPTLNANPGFDALLHGLARMNRQAGNVRTARPRLALFGEMIAERLSRGQIARLREAGFAEIEAGVQSRDPAVLRAIHRPERLQALDANIRRMARAGIRVTVDLMYGLPEQRADEVLRSLRHAWRLRGAHVQCLQTLLLPGTELRARRRKLGLEGDDVPPYGVRSTATMPATDIRRIEEAVFRRTPPDSPTRRFAGRRLPDLFPTHVRLDERNAFRNPIRPAGARCAIFFRGDDLFSRRLDLLDAMRRALRAEPHALWQFVLQPAREEPLDLLDALCDELNRHPRLWQDRMGAPAALRRLASRRVFILLRRGQRYSRSWVAAAENLLAERFY